MFLQLLTFGFIIGSGVVELVLLPVVLLVSNLPTHIPESSSSPNVKASGVYQFLGSSVLLYLAVPFSFTSLPINLISISPGKVFVGLSLKYTPLFPLHRYLH